MKQVECWFCTNVGAPCTMCDDCLSDDELQWQWKEWHNDCPSDTSFQWQWKEWADVDNGISMDDIPF